METSASTTTTTTTQNSSTTLTVVVLNSKSEPVSGAKVSISPSDASGTTNGAGEIQFVLGAAKKYEITASSDGKTVTVPYYVTEGGATRLVVNPVYVQSVEARLHRSFFTTPTFLSISGVVLIVALFVAWRLYKNR